MSGGQQTTLGKYQIIREIARSNDVVYEAYDPVMNRRVALKELAILGGATQAQREERVRRFIREAKAAGSLNHPNIVTIYECGEDSGRYYIAMEFLEGHTLRNELDTHGFLEPARALDIAREVLRGLDYAHRAGVIHRDIKPENIQLLPEGRVKITDFGIARLTFEPNLTVDGQVFGTPSYMSPEQVVGKEIDARSDLFSLGVVLYEMLAGQKPFTGDNVVAISMAITSAQPAQPQQANHTVWQLLCRALEKSPALRFPTAADMLEAVDHALATLNSVVLDPYLGSSVPAQQGIVAPPIGNPYVGATLGSQQPIVYPFDPYQQQTASPQIPPAPPGYPPFPVYFPPPSRGPLVSPETKAFLGKLFLTVLILGTLFGLVIVVINALGTVVERQKAEAADRALRESASSVSAPLETRIKQKEELIGKLKDEVGRREESRDLAKLYVEMGQRSLREGDLVSANIYFENAVERDPTNPDYAETLASLYLRQAEVEASGEQRRQLLENAANYWYLAARYETDRARKQRYADDAANAYYHIALELIELGYKSVARDKLYLARRAAILGSEATRSEIESMIEALTQP